MYFDGYGYHGTSFEQTYRCYPASFIDKPQLENGDKIIMPPSALDRLASLHIDYPMLFELRNSATERVSHCGVLEFIAEEGMIYMPYWMMENLLLQEGDVVRVKNVTLPKGTYVKLQPHTKDFLDISNPKAILETTLRSFSCLTRGDSIMVAYNNKKYYIDIIESKPAHAISIIETDCEVDFAPPLDYKEPERPPVSSLPSTNPPPPQGEAAPVEEPKFNPFTGSGRRLDGKPLNYEPPPVTVTGSKEKQQPPATGSTSQTTSRQSQGKLVFGSNANPSTSAPQNQKQKEVAKEEQAAKKEEAKFQAFTGLGKGNGVVWISLVYRFVGINPLNPSPLPKLENRNPWFTQNRLDTLSKETQLANKVIQKTQIANGVVQDEVGYTESHDRW